ncbi:hypothetical protein Taro_013692, partial [Colocasia esculenta]|nr:hypothetical protein [Colocasia esculenta]
MSIADPSHTFHSANSSGHHVTEEHVIEEDEEDEINCSWNVPRAEINNPRHVLRLYRSELDHHEDYQMHVPNRVLRQFGRVQPIPDPVDVLDRVTRKGRGHIDSARYFAHFVQMWHRRRDYIIPPDEDIVGIGRVEYMSWYWSITKQYIGRPGFTYDMRYEPRDHIERSLVEGMKHLHMMVTDALQDDMISDSTQSRYIAMQIYIDSVLSQVQRTDSSTSDAGPSEPCAGTPQQPDDAGPPQFSLDVMTVSQYGLYDVGASQILTDEDMLEA